MVSKAWRKFSRKPTKDNVFPIRGSICVAQRYAYQSLHNAKRQSLFKENIQLLLKTSRSFVTCALNLCFCVSGLTSSKSYHSTTITESLRVTSKSGKPLFPVN